MNLSLLPFRPVEYIDNMVCDISISSSTKVISICYRIKGSLENIQWPNKKYTNGGDELWHSTCFECFFGSACTSEYYEFNQSPGGDVAFYKFAHYRGKKRPYDTSSDYTFSLALDEFECFARIDMPLPYRPPFYIGPAAIIKDNQNELHYFGISHPEKGPDFHSRSHHKLVSGEVI